MRIWWGSSWSPDREERMAGVGLLGLLALGLGLGLGLALVLCDGCDSGE